MGGLSFSEDKGEGGGWGGGEGMLEGGREGLGVEEGGRANCDRAGKII